MPLEFTDRTLRLKELIKLYLGLSEERERGHSPLRDHTISFDFVPFLIPPCDFQPYPFFAIIR
jgi:hypothetical protein